jgi:hypothetical protein
MSRRTGRPSYLQTPPAPAHRTSGLSILGAVTAVLVVALVGGLVGFTLGRPDDTESQIADMRAAEVERDARQIVELTDLARRTGQQMAPILVAVREHGESGQAPEPTQLDQWRQTMGQLTEAYADPPSGSTATNVARGGLRSAVAQATVAVDSVALAASTPDALRRDHLTLAARQATLAATTWSVAATQLDQINIDAGNGHQHVHLDTGEADGALTPDGAAEGTGG